MPAWIHTIDAVQIVKRIRFITASSGGPAACWAVAIFHSNAVWGAEFRLILEQASQAVFLLFFGAFVDLVLVGNDVAEQRDNFVVILQFEHAVKHLLHFYED